MRRAMQRLPLRALIREIKDIDVFLVDFSTDSHQVGSAVQGGSRLHKC